MLAAPDGTLTRSIEVELPGPRLPHDMAFTEHYAILNDRAHDYNMLTYYISGKKQIEQLRAAGFAVQGLWGMKGERLREDEVYVGGYSIYYLAKRHSM